VVQDGPGRRLLPFYVRAGRLPSTSRPAGNRLSPWPTNREPRCALRSDDTNVASLGRNLLLDNKLRLLFGSSSNKHENMQKSIFGFETSRIRVYRYLLNCYSFDEKAMILAVNYNAIMVSAKASNIRVVGPKRAIPLLANRPVKST
jgi:hypothetical protein